MVGRLSGRRIYDAWRLLLFLAFIAVMVLAPLGAFGYVDVEAYLAFVTIYFITFGIWFGWPSVG